MKEILHKSEKPYIQENSRDVGKSSQRTGENEKKIVEYRENNKINVH